MDLNPTDDQQQLIDTVASLYANEATTERVRDAEPLGFHKELWTRLEQIGITTMAVGESAGGWGASLLDLALIAEPQGRFVAPAPVIEVQTAARLLSRLDSPAAGRTLSAVLSGERLVTVAVRAAEGDTAELVPAGAIADEVIVLQGERLLLVDSGSRRHVVANTGSLPLADFAITADSIELGTGEEAHTAYWHAVTEWMALTANALVGVAARALELGVEYAKERHAFGAPIGSFQGVAHRLADDATDVDGARLLAREAAWAESAAPRRFAQLAAMAFAFAAETACRTTYDSLHFHGGYGFMLEYDIQLYFRRARAWGAVLAEPRALYRRVADERHRDKELTWISG